MDIFAFNRFLAVLTFTALGIGLVLAIPQVRRRLSADLGGSTAWMAFVIAGVATAGSLLYSEYFGLEPCRLCWYQRIAMYPLVAVIGIGAFRRDRGVRFYGIPVAAAGLVISIYHYLIQTFPNLSGAACSVGVPCTAKYVNTFGFMSIPFMAGAGFLAIISLLSSYRPTSGEAR